ncbi:MAG: negative regulator of flagellin synthesis FlgM [Alcanivorax sp.]|jgi:negative regulator of flagellin synthesis FlgM
MKDIDNSMSIRIPGTELNKSSLQSAQVRDKPNDGGPTASDGSVAGVGDDTVTITSSAAGMLKLEQSLADIPDVDQARVTAIRASIAEGNYHIEADKIVDKLLGLEEDLT